MKTCPRCGVQLDDSVAFCPNCGLSFNGAPAPAPVTYADPYDHTASYDPQDISDNKVYCMLIYLMGAVGIIIALLASRDSGYVRFHVRQCVKITVCEMLLGILAAVLAITFIVPIVAGLAMIVLLVVQIICFFRICKGQAKEAPIVCKLNFLR